MRRNHQHINLMFPTETHSESIGHIVFDVAFDSMSDLKQTT